MAYLTLDELHDRSVLPEEYFDEIEAARPGWTLAQLEQASKWVDSRLRKRYAVPFASPYPETVKEWVQRIVTMRALLRRGVESVDQQFEEIREDAASAKREVLEAADGNTGLFDLPIPASSSTSGVSKGGPLVYSEHSPYVGFDLQRETGRDEDGRGRGT